MQCLVCSNATGEIADREGIIYLRCDNCGSISTDMDIKPLIETQNDNPGVRNSVHTNTVRISRLDGALCRKPLHVLDYGCGQGELVELMKSQGIDASGVDLGSLGNLLDFKPNTLDAVTMIEVIEHLYGYDILRLLTEKLKIGGIIMIETTFADSISDMRTNPYVDPRIGHVCILSRLGLMNVLPLGLEFEKSLNPHVMILRKTA